MLACLFAVAVSSSIGDCGRIFESEIRDGVIDGTRTTEGAMLHHLPTSKCANTLTDDEKASGWRLVWDGKTFDGWVAVKSGLKTLPEKGWVIEEGTLSMRPVNGISSDGKWFPLSPGERELGGGGDIVTVKKYCDFMFKFDFRMTRRGNSGVKYFYDERQNGGTCEEYQILDEG